MGTKGSSAHGAQRRRDARWRGPRRALGVASGLWLGFACASQGGGSDSETHFVCRTEADCDQYGQEFQCVDERCVIVVEREPDGSAVGGGGVSSLSTDSGSGGTASDVDSGSSGGQSSPTDASDSCAPRATLPGLPTGVEDGVDNVFPFVAIQYVADFGDAQAALGQPSPTDYLRLGFDLDEECSVDGVGAECVLPPWAQGVNDGPGGIDNAYGAILQGVRAIVGDFTSERQTEMIQEGGRTHAIRVAGWNGLPDDGEVEVAVLQTAAFDSTSPGAVPRWDGTDVWPVATTSVGRGQDGEPDPMLPLYADTRAYVSAGQLVASLPTLTYRQDAVLGLGDVRLELPLVGVALVCSIANSEDTVPSLGPCILAGRMQTDALIHQLGQFPDPNDLINLLPLCFDGNPNSNYQRFKAQVCGFTDVAAQLVPPTEPCDGLSVGVRLETRPGLLGDVIEEPEPEPRCPSDRDPGLDSCDPELGLLGTPTDPADAGDAGAARDAGSETIPDAGADDDSR